MPGDEHGGAVYEEIIRVEDAVLPLEGGAEPPVDEALPRQVDAPLKRS